MQRVQTFCKLFSEESKFLHGKAAASYLDFMPSPMVIRASFDDLLLVAPGGCDIRDYYICNPLTKQWFKLPEAPIGRRSGFALVCIPDSSKSQVGFSINAQYQYKVVLMNKFSLGTDAEDYKFRVSIFCSKSGKWSQSVLSCPKDKVLRAIHYVDVVTCNGILYWLEDNRSSKRMFAFDLFNDQCRVIDFPDDCVRGWQNSYGKVHLGAVCGELQLLQIFNTNEEGFVLKVWELNHSTWWVLVHEINLKRPPGTKRMVGLAVHPINRNVVFMIWDKYVFQYKIMEDMYEKVDKLREPINVGVYRPVWSCEGEKTTEMVVVAVNSLERFSTFPLVHPAWPTRVPAHPSPI
ncbi:F-box protein At5g49610 [Morus notabilis]|nr:F-box protein At5g49610 [Morus notabilis]